VARYPGRGPPREVADGDGRRSVVSGHLVERPGQQYPDPVPLPTAAELESDSAYCPIPIDGSQL